MIGELNEFLQPIDAPVSQQRGYVSGVDFDSQYRLPPGALDYTNIKLSSRPFTAVVSLSGDAGTFKDIQLAINYVHQYGGGTVFIRQGTYTINASITMYSSIEIVGESQTTTIIDFNTTSSQILCSSISNFKIRNLSLINGRSATGAIYLDQCNYYLLDRIYFSSNSDSGGNHADIYFNFNSQNGLVNNCYSTLAGTFCLINTNGILTQNSFTFNNIFGSKKYAFSGDGRGSYIGNNIQDFVISAINGNFDACRITNNYIDSNSNTAECIVISSGIQNSINNNYIKTSNANKGCVLLKDNSYDSQIVGNYIEANGTGKAVVFNASGDTANTLVGNRLIGGYTNNGSSNNITGNV